MIEKKSHPRTHAYITPEFVVGPTRLRSLPVELVAYQPDGQSDVVVEIQQLGAHQLNAEDGRYFPPSLTMRLAEHNAAGLALQLLDELGVTTPEAFAELVRRRYTI